MKHYFSDLHTSRRVRGLALITALIVFVALVQPVSAQAQDAQDDWQWRGTIYAWLPTISGNTAFPSDGGSPIEADTSDILGGLDFTFMGVLKGRKGSWGFTTDVLYLDVGGRESSSRDLTIGPGELPADVTASVNLDIKSLVWTVAGTYNLSATSRHEADLLLGARLLDMEQTLKWNFSGNIGDLPLPGRSGKSKVSVADWDAVIGITGHSFIGDEGRWAIPYYFDIGTGDSDLTWQAMAGIGYQFDWGALVLTYRYLDYDSGSGSPITDLTISGPMLGASFTW